MKARLSPFGATLIMPGCAVASRAEPRKLAASDTARATFEHFVDLLYRRRQVRAAFETCVAAQGFADHAGDHGIGRARAMAHLCERFASDIASLELQHVVFDRDIGMVHLTVQRSGAQGAEPRVDIYRVADGRIVEHWAVA